jgi:hypothetical protein
LIIARSRFEHNEEKTKLAYAVSQSVGPLAMTYWEGGLSTEGRRPIVTIPIVTLIEDILSRLLGPMLHAPGMRPNLRRPRRELA